MAQYIDKSAVVAEIERLFQEHSSKEYIDEGGVVLEQLEDCLDTLEVKEVDLEKEMENWIENNQDTAGFYNNVEFAKHFFGLGMAVSNKTQKGE